MFLRMCHQIRKEGSKYEYSHFSKHILSPIYLDWKCGMWRCLQAPTVSEAANPPFRYPCRYRGLRSSFCSFLFLWGGPFPLLETRGRICTFLIEKEEKLSRLDSNCRSILAVFWSFGRKSIKYVRHRQKYVHAYVYWNVIFRLRSVLNLQGILNTT